MVENDPELRVIDVITYNGRIFNRENQSHFPRSALKLGYRRKGFLITDQDEMFKRFRYACKSE